LQEPAIEQGDCAEQLYFANIDNLVGRASITGSQGCLEDRSSLLVCFERRFCPATRSSAETVNTAKKKTSTNTVTYAYPAFLSSLPDAFKHAGGQYNARDTKLFEEFGDGCGWLEYPGHSSIGPDSLLFEAEDSCMLMMFSSIPVISRC